MKRGDYITMGRGNKEGYKNSLISGENVDIDYDLNKAMIEVCKDVINSEYPMLDDPLQVKQAINNYFESCISRGLKPGNLGLYACLGLDKSEIRDILQGRVKSVDGRNVSSACVTLIKKACKGLSLYRESLASQNKLSPPIAIFWQKNFDGLEDVQRVDVAPVNTLQADKTPEQIASEIPLDTD